MKILKLTIKKQWFDMILSDEKKEEYRERKEYWNIRFFPNYVGEHCWIENDDNSTYKLAEYDAVQFTNGYGKHRPIVILECLGLDIGNGNPDWGAPLKEVFIIKLGKELSRENVK